MGPEAKCRAHKKSGFEVVGNFCLVGRNKLYGFCRYGVWLLLLAGNTQPPNPPGPGAAAGSMASLR